MTDVLPHTEQKRASRRREHAFSVPFFLDDDIQSNIIKICFTKNSATNMQFRCGINISAISG
ncbi:MAG: hypothetical protein ACLURK_02885 [Bifidobacterium sp.]